MMNTTRQVAMVVTAFGICGALCVGQSMGGGGRSGGPIGGPIGGPTYGISVIASGLEYPTGITRDGEGNLYFTQLPTPGVPGDEGGSNKVSRRDAMTGMITNITVGEPEPTFIDVASDGRLFWTCKSAGVILQHVMGETTLVVDGLAEPSGISVRNCESERCPIYLTQLPTPGVAGPDGGMNTVSVLLDGEITNITVGEPEPTEIVAAPDGTLYWTCKSAGVILTRDGATGEVDLLLEGLAAPTGIALDALGNLYFTEVPTPGVAGPDGGMNNVWKYNLGNGEFTLIHEGDPEPTAIAVSLGGKYVYWTCTVAGVIVEAVLMPAPGDLNGDGEINVLDLLVLLDAWGECPPPLGGDCPADLNGDGVVDMLDLLILLDNWG
jgi:DNA-binding beta-propeller fold protein YncE